MVSPITSCGELSVTRSLFNDVLLKKTEQSEFLVHISRVRGDFRDRKIIFPEIVKRYAPPEMAFPFFPREKHELTGG